MTTFPVPPTLRSFALAAVAIASCLSATTGRCGTIVSSTGSQGFLSLAGVLVDGTSNGNINTGTSFELQTLVTTQAGSGYFAFSGTATPQFFSNVTFNTLAPVQGPLFGSADFGTFSLQSLVEESSGSGFRSFLIVGDFTGGALGGPVTPSPAPAEFRISFTQSGGGGSTISSSATMTFAAVPEPSTLALLGFGGAAVALRTARRRREVVELTTAPRRRGWHREGTGRRCR